MAQRKSDLRVIKTEKAIKNAFKEMVMEMNASKITVKNYPNERKFIVKHSIFTTRP